MDYPELLAAYDSLETKYNNLREAYLQVSIEYLLLITDNLTHEEFEVFRNSEVYKELLGKIKLKENIL